MIIEFSSSQRYGVNIINEMFRDHSCQPTCDSWVVAVFTFISDLVAANTRPTLKYNKENYVDSRRGFLTNLATYLTIPYIKMRAKLPI